MSFLPFHSFFLQFSTLLSARLSTFLSVILPFPVYSISPFHHIILLRRSNILISSLIEILLCQLLNIQQIIFHQRTQIFGTKSFYAIILTYTTNSHFTPLQPIHGFFRLNRLKLYLLTITNSKGHFCQLRFIQSPSIIFFQATLFLTYVFNIMPFLTALFLQETGLYNSFTIGETFNYFATMYCLEGSAYKENLKVLQELLDIPKLSSYINTLR